MSKPNKHILLRIVLGVVLFLILAVAGFSIWVNQHYKKIIKTKLPGIVARSTDSAYTIALKDISINIITRRVTVYNVSLIPDTNQIKKLRARGKSYNTTFRVTIPRIQISGIMWEDLIADKEAYCKRLLISYPKIVIDAIKKTDTTNHLTDTSQNNKSSFIEKFSVDNIEVVKPDITYHAHSDTDSLYCYAKGGEIVLNNWSLDPSAPKDTTSFFFAKNGTIKLDSIIYNKPGGLYKIKTGAVAFSSDKKDFSLKDIRLFCPLSHTDFYKRVGHQKEIYDLHFPSIVLTGFDWQALINHKQLITKDINIDDPSLAIFFSRLYAPNNKSKLGKFPNQLLQKLKLKVNIDSVHLKDGHFKYTEVNEDTKRAGILLFDGIRGSLSNVTNIDTYVAQNHNCIIDLKGKFMHTSDMAAHFTLLLNDTNGRFSVDGYLKNLNADQINQQAKALAKAEIKSLHVEKMEMHVEGNQYYGRGHFTISYNNLKIELQKPGDNKDLNDKPIISFVANNLFLYPDNPMQGNDVRQEDTYLKRDIHKSFFSLIWKNIFQAGEKTAVRNQKVLEVVKKNKNNKKKGLFKTLFGKKK